MEKLNSMPQFTARLSKQPHNVGQSFAFTCSTGMLLPLYADVCHPDDKFYINPKFFARLNNPITATLGQIDFHLDWFFVPATMIFTPFGSMMYNTNDLVTSAIDFQNDTTHQHYPYLSLNDLFDDLNTEDADWLSKSFFNELPVSRFGAAGVNSVRLLDNLEFNVEGVWNFGVNKNKNITAFPWKLATYQCIYQHYYRNDDREAKDYAYQLDDVWSTPGNVFPLTSGSTETVASKLFTKAKKLMQMRFASAYKDYFTSVKVSPIASSVSNLFPNGDTTSYLNKIDQYLGTYFGLNTLSQDGSYTQSDNLKTQVGFGFSSGTHPLATANIRSIFALEKLLRIVGRADKNYESQVLAHFGFNVPHDVLHAITHIGHDMATMELSPILSTANTFNGETGSSLGEVGGNGVISFAGRERKFVAPCHGFLMCIVHCKPRYRYFGTYDKLNTLSDRLSFAQPEFDKLGMQPLYLYECDGNVIGTPLQAERLGWQFRYEQFKRKYNRASMAFYKPLNDINYVNSWSPWVLGRTPFNDSNNLGPVLTFDRFLSTPFDINNIMQVTYNGLWSDDFKTKVHLVYQRDPFICDFTAGVKKVNFMSEYGEPDL